METTDSLDTMQRYHVRLIYTRKENIYIYTCGKVGRHYTMAYTLRVWLTMPRACTKGRGGRVCLGFPQLENSCAASVIFLETIVS